MQVGSILRPRTFKTRLGYQLARTSIIFSMLVVTAQVSAPYKKTGNNAGNIVVVETQFGLEGNIVIERHRTFWVMDARRLI